MVSGCWEQAREIIAAHERELTACLSEDERAELFRLIIKVCASGARQGLRADSPLAKIAE